MSETAMAPLSSQLMAACAHLVRLAEEDGKPPVSLAIVDRTGELLCFQRMNGAPLRSVSIAIGKAYTAARMENSTQAFQARLAREALTLADFRDDNLTALPGGIPVCRNDRVVGAVGVSGRSLTDDNALAESFIRIIEQICAKESDY